MQPITSAQRRFLRVKSHHLRPSILIGTAGLTVAVLKETETTLARHELIKLKIRGDDRAHRERISNELCEDLHATLVQRIGKTLVIYRPAEKPRLALP